MTTIILIGPMNTGKSTVAKLLSEKLKLPRCELDRVRWSYYKEIGYDDDVASRIAKSDGGMLGLLQYWKPFEAYAVERVVAEHKGIIDFGAGHSVYEDETLFARVQQSLAPYPYVILLLPSPDLDESVAIVNTRLADMLQREIGEVSDEVLKVNEQFVRHPSNHLLAKMVVYTKDKTPEETCAEILEILGKSGSMT